MCQDTLSFAYDRAYENDTGTVNHINNRSNCTNVEDHLAEWHHNR